MVEKNKLQTWFLFLAFGLMAVVIFWIYQPFLQVLFAAAIFSVMLYPIFDHLVRTMKCWRGTAATITLLFAGIFVCIPLYFFVTQILQESSNLYSAVTFNGGGGNTFESLANSINQFVNSIFPTLSFQLQSYVGDFLGFISQHIGGVVSGTAFAMLEIILVALSIFLFLKDAPFFIAGFKKLSPLEDSYDEEILDTLAISIRSVIRGTFSVVVIQGLILMLGFYLFGVPNAFLWRSIAMVLSIIPGVGTAMVFVPGIFYLFFMHQATMAFGLLVWSVLIHGSVDNFVRPILYGKAMSIHPLFVMFAVLGGLNFFGPLGFLFGPVVLSAFLALYSVYEKMILAESRTKKTRAAKSRGG